MSEGKDEAPSADFEDEKNSEHLETLDEDFQTFYCKSCKSEFNDFDAQDDDDDDDEEGAPQIVSPPTGLELAIKEARSIIINGEYDDIERLSRFFRLANKQTEVNFDTETQKHILDVLENPSAGHPFKEILEKIFGQLRQHCN